MSNNLELPKHFDSIQMLRGIAALMVVIYHIPPLLGFPYYNVSILGGGVDIFFVISGFVMTLSTVKKRNDWVGFVRHRLLRVVPMYWIATALLVALLYSQGEVPGSDYVLKSLFFIPYVDQSKSLVEPVLGVGWTLNIEMIFYVLFAATMWLSIWKQICLIVAFFIFAIAVRVMLHPDPASVLFFYTSPILLEFAAGMALGALAKYLYRLPASFGYALLLGSVATAVFLHVGHELPRTLNKGGPAIVLVAACIVLEKLKFSWKPLRILGDSSYSLYLLHQIVLLSLSPIFAASVANPVISAVCLVLLSVAFGIGGYYLVEKPLVQFTRGGRLRAADALP